VTLNKDDHWPLDELIADIEERFDTEVTEVTGETNCPKCKSKNYYPKNLKEEINFEK
jgi:hypothetical protein